MKIGVSLETAKPYGAVVEQLERFASDGFSSAWTSQIFGYDALTLFAALGAAVPDIELGTAVVPVYSRHPQAMAQQALTVQAATKGRLVLGIGMSHQIVVEGMWGMSYQRPARYLREYLEALIPLLRGEQCNVFGEAVTAVGQLEIKDVTPPPVYVAALGPVMLGLAGSLATGTLTWMAGTQTIAEHIAPTIKKAAADAGRRDPEVSVSLPIVVTSKVDQAKALIDQVTAIYPTLPSYKAMLDKQGARCASDIAFVGSESEIEKGLIELGQAGATQFVANVIGTASEREATYLFLASLGKRVLSKAIL